ncbi:hypothetical protein HAALTHF_49080n [Vreelandella aquamarina]|nr:hypothetical protein HAALTHF_49080n [Halomonas axialensis]
MQPKTVGVSLVVCWGVLIAIAFWLFAYKDLRLFADDEVFARFPEEVASTAISTSPPAGECHRAACELLEPGLSLQSL